MLAAALIAGSIATGTTAQAEETKVVVDSMGNEVDVPTEIDSLVILPMPWISVVYALNGSGSIITGMQQVAKQRSIRIWCSSLRVRANISIS